MSKHCMFCTLLGMYMDVIFVCCLYNGVTVDLANRQYSHIFFFLSFFFFRDQLVSGLKDKEVGSQFLLYVLIVCIDSYFITINVCILYVD